MDKCKPRGAHTATSAVLDHRSAKFRLHTLAILPSWECDVVCHHCVFHSSPAAKGRLALDIAREAIQSAVNISTIRNVTVSGGEAFIDLDYLYALAIVVAGCNLTFRVVTNCSFARDLHTAKTALAVLRAIGVDSVAISRDAYHEQFINPERVQFVIRACRQLGISVRLTSVISRTSTLATALNALGDDAFELPITQVKCLPVGRAEKKVATDALLAPAPSDIGRACHSDFDTLSIAPTGDVYPCCAVGGFTEGIRLGRFPDACLQTLLERRDTNLKWVILASQGPKFFIDSMSSDEKGLLGLDREPIHDCVACHRIFRTQIGAEIAARTVANLSSRAQGIINCVTSTIGTPKR